MARIAFCLPAMRGHLGAHGPLARELARRGHDCVLLGSRTLGTLAAAEGVSVRVMPWTEPDLGGARLLGTLLRTARATRGVLRHAPALLREIAPDLVVADQAEPGFAMAARITGLRFVTLAAGLPIDGDDAVPPPFLSWPYEDSESARRRNHGGWQVSRAFMVLQRMALSHAARRHGIGNAWREDGWTWQVPELRQLVPGMDFPRRWPACVTGLGPLRDPGPLPPLPPELAAAPHPLVFVSLGTLSGRRPALLHRICEAADGLAVTLVLAHCNRLTSDEMARLPGRPILREMWPQRTVLAHAAVCITHGGLNTVLDSAAAGVPMLAMPLSFEQPGIAARVADRGLGLCLPPSATALQIRTALQALLDRHRWRDNLSAIMAELQAAGGVRRGADLIEAILHDGMLTGDCAHEAAE
ncbi:MAG: glycosyltransferase [Paracoccus sp. (in: a-proteobacteria)]|nr:glycosyltransferase [Paracoccus sp. (in: a-proteobacteria)]